LFRLPRNLVFQLLSRHRGKGDLANDDGVT
jgi:hypothetical protein